MSDTDDDDSSVYTESNDGIEQNGATSSNQNGNSDEVMSRNEKLRSYEMSRILNTDDLSSDDEEAGENNTIGRVPLHWYDAYDHIGYSVNGQKILKRTAKDRIDVAISNRDDPESRRTIYDMYNDREIVLSERELEIIRRVQAGAFAHPEHDDTPDYIDYFSSIREVMPISAAPDPKQRFRPSKWEMMRVLKVAKAMQEGRYVSKYASKKSDQPPVYTIWNETEDDVIAESNRFKFHLPAPKMPLPGHAESYNPPAEYLLDEEEQNALALLDDKEKPYNFIPKKHDCLRHVAGYQDFVKERFERCLDLYLCPRKLKRRLNIDPETLVPRLPRPRELKPFPNALCLQFLGHSKAVSCISISPDGQFLSSGSADGSVRLWEIDTALCLRVWNLAAPVVSVAFNPCFQHHLLVVAVGARIVLIATGTGDEDGTDITEALLSKGEEAAARADDEADPKWSKLSSDAEDKWLGCVVGPRLALTFRESVTSASWHHKGDYVATLCTGAGARAVGVHQLSKAKTQYPFAKAAGRVQAVNFHPSRPFLFVTTQQHVKVYNLVEQKLVKKLTSGCKWLSCAAVHPSGDHVVVGSYDRRIVWFDLDLSSSPYKTLKFHEKAVRSVCFHKKYPLMASASDDGTIQVFHSTVYSDLTRNPLIVPLKILRGHGVKDGLSVLAIEFHPRQPWIVTAGADGVICLFQDI